MIDAYPNVGLHPQPLVKQVQTPTMPGAGSAAHGAAVDGASIEQLLVLTRDLLLGHPPPAELPELIVQRVAVFLGALGAAIGVVEEGRYRLRASYGLAPSYAERYDGLDADDDRLRAALAGSATPLRSESDCLLTVLLPVADAAPVRSLHLVWPAADTPAPRVLALARAMALLAGIALANADRLQRAERIARWKGDSLTALAHDLRAPLTALIGYASLLGQGAFGPLTDEQRAISACLERQALELVDLLGATLDVARLETGKLPVRLDDFMLGDVLTTLRSGTFAKASREGRLVYRLPDQLPRLRSDRVKVKEIIQNLIDNALRHGGGGRVELEVAASGREMLQLTVRDTGPGIGADRLPHLFEQAGSDNGRTGFGLYLVRSFTEALGGRLAVRSAPGQGTGITVELPLIARGRDATAL